MSEWQPIETAPREVGARVLGYISDPGWPYIPYVAVSWRGDVIGWSMPGISGLNLSHWTRLPDQPGASHE